MLNASEPLPFNLTYPTVTKSSKLKQESYNKLEVYIKGEGYRKVYGQTWEQKFEYPKFENKSDKKLIKDFIIKALSINASDISKKNVGHFFKSDKEYWLKLSLNATSYSYTLLHVTPCPKIITLPAKAPYRMEKRAFDIPENPLIPDAEGFAIRRAKYVDYDEVTWHYKYNGENKHVHKGRYWKIDFAKTVQDKDSYRYILAHDYKRHLASMGAEILKDEDNSFYFKMGNTIASFGSYGNSFSLKIVQEKAFEQALILTPDAIKTELDKNGKITLDGIYFDFDKATLKPESRKAILSAVALMQRYDDLELSVHGYTDSKGNDTYNATLSIARAKAVMDAMIAEGIESKRLSYKGHGEKDPIATNDTDEGRAQNRRVELHKERGGDKKSIITIDFIKPIENSQKTETKTYQNDALGIRFTKPYSKKKHYQEFKGTHKLIGYEIIKEGKRDNAFSRKAIIKNYENVLELYNAKILGEYSNTLYFEIADRGDGKKVYGCIEAYTGSYNIRFLIEE